MEVEEDGDDACNVVEEVCVLEAFRIALKATGDLMIAQTKTQRSS